MYLFILFVAADQYLLRATLMCLIPAHIVCHIQVNLFIPALAKADPLKAHQGCLLVKHLTNAGLNGRHRVNDSLPASQMTEIDAKYTVGQGW